MAPLSPDVLLGYIARAKEQVPEGIKEGTIKMKDIIDKMAAERPEAKMGIDVFLAAGLAVSALYNGSAVQAIFFASFGLVGHAKFFLKIGTKTAVHRIGPQSGATLAKFDPACEC
jgi:hypothetical protein